MTTTYTAGARIDQYEIIRRLGKGGMNNVYLALDMRNQQQVVLKFPNDDLIGNIGVFERYKREAEIGTRLNHPNVQRLLNADEERSEHYLVMEFIQGRTLREVIDAHAPDLLPQSEALRIITQVCDALAYCHEHGVFHRDIKPENIMMLADGTVKIIDFGVALLEGARRVTWRGWSGTVGTPDYMSPEQLQGGRGFASSDIYAVGVMLYELLCGRVPFEGESIFAVMNQHVAQDPPSILEFNPHVSPELATVVMRAIRRDADKRYHTMRDMLNDLTHLEKVTPIPYKPERSQASAARRQALLAALIIIVILLAIIAFGVLAQVFHSVVR